MAGAATGSRNVRDGRGARSGTHESRSEYPTVHVEVGDTPRNDGAEPSLGKEARMKRPHADARSREATDPGHEVRSRERQEVDEDGSNAGERSPAQGLMEHAQSAGRESVGETGRESTAAGEDERRVDLETDGRGSRGGGGREDAAIPRTKVRKEIARSKIESTGNRTGDRRRNRAVRCIRTRHSPAAEQRPAEHVPRRRQKRATWRQARTVSDRGHFHGKQQKRRARERNAGSRPGETPGARPRETAHQRSRRCHAASAMEERAASVPSVPRRRDRADGKRDRPPDGRRQRGRGTPPALVKAIRRPGNAGQRQTHSEAVRRVEHPQEDG